ncbi:DUF222 domain-containing protein [Kribbella sp. NPDC006257]|uniref:HNH endonuclease signature motif containing protein n=1 Tax=Kribbella sp. NPDC006257 TaxID=3156738 RepID=UPI00339E87F4
MFESLVEMTDALTSVVTAPVATLSTDDLLSELSKIQQLESVLAARKAELMVGVHCTLSGPSADLGHSEPRPGDRLAGPAERRWSGDVLRSVSEEIALVMGAHRRTAARWLNLAALLVDRLPATLDLLRRGGLPVSAAHNIARALAIITDDRLRAAVEQIVLAWGRRYGWSKIKKIAHREARKVVAEYESLLHAQRQYERTTYTKSHDGGMADLVVSTSAIDITAIMTALTQRCRELQQAGDPRTLDQLRTDLAVHRLLGQDQTTPTTTPAATPAPTPTTAPTPAAAPTPDQTHAPAPTETPAAPNQRSASAPPETPGAPNRHSASAPAEAPTAPNRRSASAPAGAPAAPERRSGSAPVPEAALTPACATPAAPADASGTTSAPGISATAATTASGATASGSTAATSDAGIGAVVFAAGDGDPGVSGPGEELLVPESGFNPAVAVQVVIHCTYAEAEALATGTISTGGELDGYGGLPQDALAMAFTRAKFRYRLTDRSPKSDPARYTPSPGLDQHVRDRDRTCRFPGCNAPVHYCDLDHRTPFPQGPTDEDNLAAFCRHHHRLKHHGNWQLYTTDTGTLVFISPTGRAYLDPPTLPDQPAPPGQTAPPGQSAIPDAA